MKTGGWINTRITTRKSLRLFGDPIIKMLCAAAFACLIMLIGCSPAEQAEKWDRRPMVMVDGVIYLDTGKQMAVEMEESAFLGTITSSVDGSEKPTQNGESNFGGEGAPYAYLDDGLIVLLDNEWVFFEKEPQPQRTVFLPPKAAVFPLSPQDTGRCIHRRASHTHPCR